MKFSIVDVMAGTAVLAVFMSLAMYLPEVFAYAILLVHLAQIMFPFMLLLVAIAFSEQKNGQLDIKSNATLTKLTRIWQLSLAVVVGCWLVLGLLFSL